MHQNTKYAHLLVKIVGADTSLQTKLCTVFGLLSLSHSLLRNLQSLALWLSDMPAFGMLTAVLLRPFLKAFKYFVTISLYRGISLLPANFQRGHWWLSFNRGYRLKGYRPLL